MRLGRGRPSFEMAATPPPQDEAGSATLDLKQSRSPLFLQAAAILPAAPPGVRVAFILFASTPNEGWMERRQAHSSSIVALARRDVRAARRGRSRYDRNPLSALHRGDFRRGPTLPAPAVDTGTVATARVRP